MSLQPIHAAVDIVVDFADQFVRIEAENARLREAAKSSTEKLEKANNLTAEAQKEAVSLRVGISDTGCIFVALTSELFSCQGIRLNACTRSRNGQYGGTDVMIFAK